MINDKEQAITKLGLRIRNLRTAAGLTQAQLAATCDKDQQSIQRLEAGKINPSYIYLLEIAEGLNVPLSELFK